MAEDAAGMVGIVRDFLLVHEALTGLFHDHRAGRLRFEAVQALVGDDESSPLFRFKERCHAMFRVPAPDPDPEVAPGLLFDLAVGSLFHESMKLRENLYQQEVYRPRVEALRTTADPTAGELLEEFDRISASAGQRLAESIAEVEALLVQTGRQAMRLLASSGGRSGLVTRCLYEERRRVEAVFPNGLEVLFEHVHGDAVAGYLCAADSYLASAYFAEAEEVLEEARRRSPERREIAHAAAYAAGMQAFRDRDYASSVARLQEWLESGPAPEEHGRIELAVAAISHVGSLMDGEGEQAQALVRQAEALAEALSALSATGNAGQAAAATSARL